MGVAGVLAYNKYGKKKAQKAFVLIIELEFKDVEDRDKWIALFVPLAAYCAANEPGTIGYDVAIADNNEKKVLVYERYADEAAHKEVHVNSEAYLAFKAEASKIKISKKTGQSYIEQNVGYVL